MCLALYILGILSLQSNYLEMGIIQSIVQVRDAKTVKVSM